MYYLFWIWAGLSHIFHNLGKGFYHQALAAELNDSKHTAFCEKKIEAFLESTKMYSKFLLLVFFLLFLPILIFLFLFPLSFLLMLWNFFKRTHFSGLTADRTKMRMTASSDWSGKGISADSSVMSQTKAWQVEGL